MIISSATVFVVLLSQYSECQDEIYRILAVPISLNNFGPQQQEAIIVDYFSGFSVLLYDLYQEPWTNDHAQQMLLHELYHVMAQYCFHERDPPTKQICKLMSRLRLFEKFETRKECTNFCCWTLKTDHKTYHDQTIFSTNLRG